MANTYDNIMSTPNVDLLQEISRVLLLIMYALLAKTVSGYHYVKDKYLEYKYSEGEIRATEVYFLNEDGVREEATGVGVPEGRVYIEEWRNYKGQRKNLVLYPGDTVPYSWGKCPFDMPPAKCPWVWVGDKETEIDFTRTFDRFLVPGNVLKKELIDRLIKVTDRTKLIYIESGTLKEIEFPGDGITIEADVD